MICWKKIFILFFGFIFVLHVSALENYHITPCTSEHNLRLYFQQKQLMIVERPSLELLYDTATTALCIGKITIGVNLLSDLIKEYKARYPKTISPERKQKIGEILQSIRNAKQIDPKTRETLQSIKDNIALTKGQALKKMSPGFFTRDKASVVIPIVSPHPDVSQEFDGFIIIDNE